jgi:hypothetical protein
MGMKHTYLTDEEHARAEEAKAAKVEYQQTDEYREAEGEALEVLNTSGWSITGSPWGARNLPTPTELQEEVDEYIRHREHQEYDAATLCQDLRTVLAKIAGRIDAVEQKLAASSHTNRTAIDVEVCGYLIAELGSDACSLLAHWSRSCECGDRTIGDTLHATTSCHTYRRSVLR